MDMEAKILNELFTDQIQPCTKSGKVGFKLIIYYEAIYVIPPTNTVTEENRRYSNTPIRKHLRKFDAHS